MGEKINLGVFLGGRSCEHEVSVVSARSVLEAVDRDQYNVFLIGIDKQGKWYLARNIDDLIQGREVKPLPCPSLSHDVQNQVTLDLYHRGNLSPAVSSPIDYDPVGIPSLDVVFPVLHGTFGEDGTVQGVFEMAGLPYVGCGVAASAIAMDKALAKQIFKAAGIPQSPCMITSRFEWEQDPALVLNQAVDTLGYPIFVKPANMGSSVGVSKAHDADSLRQSVELAFDYDNKVIIERSMEDCQEVECAVLGNQNPIASVVGEIIPGAEFYDYQTKYIDDKTETLIPARISDQAAETVRELSISAFKAIGGTGLSRVDFFVHKDTGEVYLNEINTLPGFTPISMYPKLWAASGIPYAGLIDQLVELAITQHQSKASLKRAF